MTKGSIYLLMITFIGWAQNTAVDPVINQYRKSIKLGIGASTGFGTESFTEIYQSKAHNYLKYKAGSWGKGVELNVSYSYKVHPNIALGASLGWFEGLNKKAHNQYYEDSISTTTKQDISYRAAHQLRLSPHIVFEAFVNANNALYARIGYVFASGKMTVKTEESYYDLSGSDAATFHSEITGGTIHGSNFALGFRAKAGDLIAFFVELNANTLKQKVKEETLISATSGNIDIMPYIDPYFKKTIYVDRIDVQNLNSQNLSQPKQDLSYYAVYNSLGLHMGLCFYLP